MKKRNTKPAKKRVRTLLRIREVRMMGVELVLQLPTKSRDLDARAFEKLVRAADRFEASKVTKKAAAE